MKISIKTILTAIFILLFISCGDSDNSNDGEDDSSNEGGGDADFEETTEITELKVMSYNIRYAENEMNEESSRVQPLIESINEHKPDLLGVQEANEPWMSVLPSLLPDYSFVGIGRDDGESLGEFAAIFYLKEKFTILESHTFWLSETPEEPSYGWGANHRRVCTYAYIKSKETGQIVAHFNTHLDHESEEARINGVALILEKITTSPYPVILTGDLNFLEGTDLYKVIDETSLTDSKFIAEDTMSHATSNFNQPIQNNFGVIADFVFVEDEFFKVKKYEVDFSREFDGKPVSDHYPVIVDIETKLSDQ